MKSANTSTKGTGNLDRLVSKFSVNEILSLQAMSNVRGGVDDGDGSDPIIIIPPPPEP